MKPHRIFISAHDPRNPVMAERAGTLAWVQWLVILVCVTGVFEFQWTFLLMVLALTAVTVLMFAGWRGIICGHAKSFGSLVLFATNLFFVLYFLVWTFWNYFKYNLG